MRIIRSFGITASILALTISGTGVGVGQSTEPAADPRATATFTGRISFGPLTVAATEVTVGDVTQVRGNVFAVTIVSMSDPRLEGTATRTFSLDVYPIPGTDGETAVLWVVVTRIENAAGAWEGVERRVSHDGRDVPSATTAVLVGEGAYEGMTASFELANNGQGWDVWGVIVPGDAPTP